MQDDDGLWRGEDALVLLEESEDDLTHTLVVFVILDADGPLHTAELFVGEVRHEATAEEAVGDEGRLVIGRQYLGVEETDGLDRAISTLRRDEVAELEGLGDDDDDPTSQILQLATESHTDSQTHRGQDGSEGYGLHAEHTSQEEEEGDVQYRSEDRVKE